MTDAPTRPQPTRPRMPAGYGIATGLPATLPKWDAVEAKLTAARNFWIGTTSPQAVPHAAPVWGLWHEHTLHFSTDPTSRKARNLAANPRVVVHLDSGDDVVILHGTVEPIDPGNLPPTLFDTYHAKYGFRPDPADANGAWYRLRPELALTWTEADFVDSAVRWDW